MLSIAAGLLATDVGVAAALFVGTAGAVVVGHGTSVAFVQYGEQLDVTSPGLGVCEAIEATDAEGGVVDGSDVDDGVDDGVAEGVVPSAWPGEGVALDIEMDGAAELLASCLCTIALLR